MRQLKNLLCPCIALLADWGAQKLLPVLAMTSLVGAAITWLYRIETSGLDLERV